jgi:hypothetical protein
MQRCIAVDAVDCAGKNREKLKTASPSASWGSMRKQQYHQLAVSQTSAPTLPPASSTMQKPAQ